MAYTEFPLQFKRQYAASLDKDIVFVNNTALQAYLSDPVRYAGQIATCNEFPTKIYILNNTLDSWVESTPEIPPAVGGYANNLYFSEIASDVATYETLSYTPDAATTIETWSVVDTDGEKTLRNYLYPTGVGISLYPSGLWSFSFFGKVNNVGGVTQLGVTYFKRSTGGTETDLFTDWSNEIDNLTDDWIKFDVINPTFTVNPTDRMGIRVKIKTTSNVTKTITYEVGDGHSAYINTPANIRHSQIRVPNESVSVQHIDANTTKATPVDADSAVIWDSVALKAVRTTFTNIKSFLSVIFRLKTEQGDAHGFVNPPNVGCFTISNVGSSVTVGLLAAAGKYKINGTEYPNTGLSITFTAALGQNFICANPSGLVVSAFDILDLSKTPVCTVTWDGTDAILGDELHLAARNLLEHKKQHDTDGARWVNGFVSTFGSGATNTFSSALGTIRDEERYHEIGLRSNAMILYRNAALTSMISDPISTRFAKLVGTTTGSPYYDNNGVLTTLGVNNYGAMWMYATNRKMYSIENSPSQIGAEIIFVMGQGTYPNIAAAQSAPQPTLTGFSTAEWKLLYRVIIRQVSGALSYIQADDLRLTSTGPSVSGGGITNLAASQVIFTPSGNIVASNVQAAIEEVNAKTITHSYTLDFQNSVTILQDKNLEGNIRITDIQTDNVATLTKGVTPIALPFTGTIDITNNELLTWTITRTIAGMASVGIKYIKI